MERPLNETLIDDYDLSSPTGTPTERLVWIALWHTTGSYPYRPSLYVKTLHRHVGGSMRALESALKALEQIGIVTKRKDPDMGWLYSLAEPYRQQRLVPDWARCEIRSTATGATIFPARDGGENLPVRYINTVCFSAQLGDS